MSRSVEPPSFHSPNGGPRKVRCAGRRSHRPHNAPSPRGKPRDHQPHGLQLPCRILLGRALPLDPRSSLTNQRPTPHYDPIGDRHSRCEVWRTRHGCHCYPVPPCQADKPPCAEVTRPSRYQEAGPVRGRLPSRALHTVDLHTRTDRLCWHCLTVH